MIIVKLLYILKKFKLRGTTNKIILLVTQRDKQKLSFIVAWNRRKFMVEQQFQT